MKKSSIAILGVILLVCALALTGCGNGSTSGGGDSSALSGTWTGNVQGHTTSNTTFGGPATLTCSGSNWTLSIPAANVNESGTVRHPVEGAVFLFYQGNTQVGSGILGDNILTPLNFYFETMSFTCTLTKQ